MAREADPQDARGKRLHVTARGRDLLRETEEISDAFRALWERRIGAAELASLEKHLAELVGASPSRFDTPGRVMRDHLEEPV